MSDKKRVRPVINTDWLKSKLGQLMQWVMVKANTLLPQDNTQAVLGGLLTEVANEYGSAWTRFETDHCVPLGEAIDRVREDMIEFNGERLAETCEGKITAAENVMTTALRKEAVEKVQHDQGRASELRQAQEDLDIDTEAARLQKIRTCGDENAPIDPATGREAIIKAVSEIIMIGVAIGIEVMIGIKAQQHGSNLLLAVGITAAALLLMFTTAHYGMTSLKRIIAHPDFVEVFNEKYPVASDGYHYDRYGKTVELAHLESGDRFIAFACLLVCFATCAVVVGYRFIAVEGSKLAETTNLGAILMVMLTALFSIEKFAFALKFNEDEYNNWVRLTNRVQYLRARVNELLGPDEAANSLFRQACDGIENIYIAATQAALAEVTTTTDALNETRLYCLTLWNDYLGHATDFVEVHFRNAVETLISVSCSKSGIRPDSLGLSFAEIKALLGVKMTKKYDNPTQLATVRDFRYNVPLAGNLVLTNFAELEAQILREEEARVANAAVTHYRLGN